MPARINPPPGKPVLHELPTPNLADRVVVVLQDSRAASFQLPQPGAPLASNPDFLFSTARTAPDVEAGGEWYRLFYVNERSNQPEYNAEVSFPYETTEFPRYTRTSVVLRSTYAPEDKLSDDPGVGALKLVDEKLSRIGDPIMDSLFVGVVKVYESIPGPLLNDKTRGSAQGHMSIIPFNFRASKKTLTLEQNVEQSVSDVDVVGGTCPGVSGDNVLMESELTSPGTVLAKKRNTYFEGAPGVLQGSSVHLQTGMVLPYKREIVANGTQGSGVDPVTGIYVDIEPHNDLFAIKETRKALIPFTRTYQKIVEHPLPPVLDSLEFIPVGLKNGGVKVLVWHHLTHFHGPFLAVVTEQFTLTAPTMLSVGTVLKPEQIQYEGIYFNVNIEACLHDSTPIHESTGTKDATYAYTTIDKTFPATSPSTMPDTITLVDTEPYQGGYLVRTTVIYVKGTPGSGSGSGSIPGLPSTGLGFGSVAVGSTKSQTLGALWGGLMPITIYAINMPAGFGTSGITYPLILNPGDEYSITYTFSPTAVDSCVGAVTLVTSPLGAFTDFTVTGTGV